MNIRVLLVATTVMMALASTASADLGVQLSGIGPVNRSMGGAATAAPLDAIGALHWNPATTTQLRPQLAASIEVINPVVDMTSTIGPFSGTSESDAGWTPVPGIGLIHRAPDSAVTFGLGLYGHAGFSLNYPASATNPILFPQTPTGATPIQGFGRIYAEFSNIQIAPTVALEVTEQLSFGFGPTINIAKAYLTPFPFVDRNDANGDGVFTWPNGTGTRTHWGGGLQAGLFYRCGNGWNVGASYKSRQWFEQLSYNSEDEEGLPLGFTTPLDLPAIASLGVAYDGWEDILVAVDVRHTDYEHTRPFGRAATFGPGGELTGLGWQSIWSVSLGAQLRMTEALDVRVGYAANESPIRDGVAAYNVATPLILQHSIAVGGTIHLTDSLDLQTAYNHGFTSGVEGPVPGAPAGSVVGYNVTAHMVSLGLAAYY